MKKKKSLTIIYMLAEVSHNAVDISFNMLQVLMQYTCPCVQGIDHCIVVHHAGDFTVSRQLGNLKLIHPTLCFVTQVCYNG